ncbi:MAG: hypothetical protein CMJ20_03810 [Phycisphaeraceae bacterium]|nr:hypothetical protein [Phycisphaeraceae bacterium]
MLALCVSNGNQEMSQTTSLSPTPDVAVVVTTYNRSQFLSETIESVINQKFDGRTELVIVDDGSTDNTADLADLYCRRFSDPLGDLLIRYVFQDNQGLAVARNTGVFKTNAPLIAFVDDDDLVEPTKTQAQVDAFHQDPQVGLVHTSFRYVDYQGRLNLGDRSQPQRVDNPCVGSCVNVLLNELLVISSTVMVRRQILMQAAALEPHGLPYDPKWVRSQDYDMALRMARISKFAYVATPQLRYRLHDSNIAMSKGNIKTAYEYHCRVQIDFVRRYGHEFGIDENEVKQRAATFLLQRANSCFWRRRFTTALEICDLADEMEIGHEAFQAVRAKASRPVWIYKAKDYIDQILGRDTYP